MEHKWEQPKKRKQGGCIITGPWVCERCKATTYNPPEFYYPKACRPVLP